MIDSRQQAYLDAMGIGIWCLRDAPAISSPVPSTPAPAEPALEKSPGLKLGPGGGGVLLICATDEHSSSRLANDISRTLGSVPVWAWPDGDDDGVELTDAVDDNLFTTVAIFGKRLSEQFFSGELPVSLSGANLVLLPAMEDIQSQAEARRALWVTLCRTGMVKH